MATTRGSVLAAVAAVSSLSLVLTAGAAAAEGPSETCVPAAIPFDAEDIHLTGRWATEDGVMYYVRQVGDTVWFSAMSDYEQREGEIGRAVTSVGRGTLEGTELRVEFADVPRGNIFNAGSLTVTLGPDEDGHLQAVGEAPPGETGQVITPCQPGSYDAVQFARPFRYTVPFGLAVAHWPGSQDLQVMSTPDMGDFAGISFWVLGPAWRTTCSAPADLAIPEIADPASVEAYLRAIPELVIGEAGTTTVAGLPATVLDVTASADAMGCDDDEYVRMFEESGSVSGVGAGMSARLHLVDLGGATFVAEVWGSDPEAWWPVAATIIDTLTLEPAATPAPSEAPTG